MTELHNMSVPPRSLLHVQRAELSGRRYRIALAPWTRKRPEFKNAALTRFFREDGAACALALLGEAETMTVAAFRAEIAKHRRDAHAPAALSKLCEAAMRRFRLPERFGFFVEESSWRPGDRELSGAAAIAILAARSGPLYLPGRFEPSLITPGEVTLFFPFGSD